ncbi:MAG: MarR family winged helix-turn-helix transcriptional regulator [Kofleriaceae bacterium]
MASRLESRGFPALRPAHASVLTLLSEDGVRLSALVSALALPKQTVGDLLDDLERWRMVERHPDPDHGVQKRVYLGPRGKAWTAEVRRVAARTEAEWASRLGRTKMKSLRGLLEELAAKVEAPAPPRRRVRR